MTVQEAVTLDKFVADVRRSLSVLSNEGQFKRTPLEVKLWIEKIKEKADTYNAVLYKLL